VFIGPTGVHNEKNIKNNVSIEPTDGFTEPTTTKTNCTIVYYLANETMVERQSCENRFTNLFKNINVTQVINSFVAFQKKSKYRRCKITKNNDIKYFIYKKDDCCKKYYM